MNEGLVLFGAGDDGRRLLNLLDAGQVAFFVDNDEGKTGKLIRGIPVCGPEKLLSPGFDRRVVISVSSRYQGEIAAQLRRMGIDRFITASDLLKEVRVKSDPRIRGLKNRFSGQRCFLIGTGPSLAVRDLDRLAAAGEITFASNKIYKIFGQTGWRPQLYCISDMDVFHSHYDVICSLGLEYQFLVNLRGIRDDGVDPGRMEGPNKYTFHIFKEEKVDGETGEIMPAFSAEPDRYVVDGGITVTYSMLQWACFLGFSEIYLLGVDFDYGDATGCDANRADHFCRDYVEPGEVVNCPKLAESLKAYRAAEDYSRSHHFRIYNATRGGKLEVFERREFDRLF